MQKVLSKTSADQTQQYIKRMICCARLECKGSSTFFKNKSIGHVNKQTNKKTVIISINAEKQFDKTRQSLTTNALSKQDKEETPPPGK